MAGTDVSRKVATTSGAPAIVLVRPQLAENVGAAARAMLNCGLTDLRLVAPRDGWPDERAVPTASGATSVLDRVRVFDTLEAAIADLELVYAATARRRDMIKPVVTPRRAADEMHRAIAGGQRCGIVFGPERTGLESEEVVLASAILTVPLNPAFSSLNLAQAVLLVAWEWLAAADGTPGRETPYAQSPPATSAQLLDFFDHLEAQLDEAGFFRTPELRPSMVRALRNLLRRAEPSDQEVRTLHGVLVALSRKRRHELGDG